jgi:hypothetical protein
VVGTSLLRDLSTIGAKFAHFRMPCLKAPSTMSHCCRPFRATSLRISLLQGLRTSLRCVLHPWLPSLGRSAAVLRVQPCAENKKLSVCFTGRQRPQPNCDTRAPEAQKKVARGQAQSEAERAAPGSMTSRCRALKRAIKLLHPDVTIVRINCAQFEEFQILQAGSPETAAEMLLTQLKTTTMTAPRAIATGSKTLATASLVRGWSHCYCAVIGSALVRSLLLCLCVVGPVTAAISRPRENRSLLIYHDELVLFWIEGQTGSTAASLAET